VRGEKLRGWCSPFYRGRGSAGEGWPGLTPTLMALTPLMMGGLRGELRGRSEQLGRREPKGKAYSRRDATDARARWAGLAVPAGQVARKVGRAESKEKEFLN
jgi:hypothetical protein